MRNITLFISLVLSLCVAACGSSSGGGGDSTSVSMPDISDLALQILPSSATPITTDISKSISWTGQGGVVEPFTNMLNNIFSTAEAAGNDSIFNTIDLLAMINTELSTMGGFGTTTNPCPSPTTVGLEGSSTSLTSSSVLSVPLLGSITAGEDYECLMTVTGGIGDPVEYVTYAFGTTKDSSNNTYVNKFVMAVNLDSDGNLEYNLMHYNYDKDADTLSFGFFNSYDCDEVRCGIGSTASGEPNSHMADSFTLTKRSFDVTGNCSEATAGVENAAYKTAGLGTAASGTAGFAVKMARVCDQGASADPIYVCIDGSSNTLATDTAICDGYAASLEALSFQAATGTPKTVDDYANGNKIIVQ